MVLLSLESALIDYRLALSENQRRPRHLEALMPPHAPVPPPTIPGYTVHPTPMGHGMSGSVYRATRQTPPLSDVALKVLRLAAQDSVLQERERFHREGKVLTQLPYHKHVVGLYTVGTEPHFHFVMEYLPGGTLQDRIQQHPTGMAPAQVLDMLKGLASGLAHLHQHSIVHRDVKPSNSLFRQDGTAVLVDFGAAKLLDEKTLTKTGWVLGTLDYIAPEQVRGERLDGRADLYSLGVIAYQMLTGRLPFYPQPGRDAKLSLSLQHLSAPLPALPQHLPWQLRQVVEDLLQKQPADRHETAALLLECLERIDLSTAPPPPPPIDPKPQWWHFFMRWLGRKTR